jgi:hypothetical protein
MSGNASIQAAQRRRAAPNTQDKFKKTTPTTSINSAQIFANQVKNNVNTGKLAGQRELLAQKEIMQQQANEQKNNNGISNINKMSLPQAITLITLRLGKVETLLQNMSLDNDNSNMFDKELIHVLMERLDTLEKNKTNNNIGNNNEIIQLKQNIDKNIVPIISQSRTNIANLVKENNILKQQINELNNDLNQTKEFVSQLQNLIINNQLKEDDIIIENNILEVDHEINHNDINNRDDEQLDDDSYDNNDNNDNNDEEIQVDISQINIKDFTDQEINIEM